MRHFTFIALVILTLSSCTEKSKTFIETDISIVPKPTELVLSEGSFLFSNDTKMSFENEAQKPAAKYLSDLFENAAGFPISISETKENASIIFLKEDTIKFEAYHLKVTPDKIIIKASDAAGYFYAVQTIRQLLPASIETANSNEQNWLIPSITINDTPRFSWRGMHMDFSRHFFSIDEIKTFLNYMALYKLNTYHMHLTDDQGWRIEIKNIHCSLKKVLGVLKARMTKVVRNWQKQIHLTS